jgi:hypothetical protein
MRSARRRKADVAVALAVLAATAALAVIAVGALSGGAAPVDCDTYVFPRRSWDAARRAYRQDDGPARRLARDVVRCDLVLGRTRREVRALLGAPDGLVPGDAQWSYGVGVTRSIVDPDDVYLTITFARDRAVRATRP